MKKFSLIILSFFVVLMCNAQNQKLPTLRKNSKGENVKVEDSKNENATTTSTSTSTLTSAITSNTTVTADDNILQDAVKQAFIVVRQSYNIRKNGVLVDGNDFFGHRYAVLPMLMYGYGVDALYEKPWENDKRYAEYADCSECLVTVDMVQYKKLSDEGDYGFFDLEDRVSETLASNFFYVQDNHFDNKGFVVQVGSGVKKGYMVWFVMNNDKVSPIVQPLSITFNENMVFPVPQPRGGQEVLGGYFVNLNMSVPGTITMELLGVARYEPNDGGKWELVKMQKEPDLFMFTNDMDKQTEENPTFNNGDENAGEAEFGSDAYIQAKKGKKKRK